MAARSPSSFIRSLLLLCMLLVFFSHAVFALSPGDLDPDFNASDIGFGNGDGIPGDSSKQAYSIAIQSDGKILIGGFFTKYNGVSVSGVIRLHSNGTLDTSFSAGSGLVNVNGSGDHPGIRSIALQGDGKILVAGDFTSYNGTARNHVARLNSDGSLDATFNPSGITGTFGGANFVVIQPDGKILVQERFGSVLRLNSDGSLNALLLTSAAQISMIALQNDGKILASGRDFSSNNGTAKKGIVRVNPDGTLDTIFNSGLGINEFGDMGAMVIQEDGKILVGGTFTSYNGTAVNYIARLNGDGSLDATFNTSGIAGAQVVQPLAVQSDGKILISYSGPNVGGFARLNSNGSLDATFSTDAGSTPNMIALQADEKIITVGWSIQRLNSNGSTDTLFNAGSGANAPIHLITQQTSDYVLIVGDFTKYNGINRNGFARLNSNGELDTTFILGSGVSNYEYGAVITSMAVQTDRKILIGGWFRSYNGIVCNNIARLNSDGSMDPTFNPGAGTYNPEDPVSHSIKPTSVDSIIVQPDGKILIAGYFQRNDGFARKNIARLNSDGSIDTTFNSINSNSDVNESIRAMVLLPNGKILVAGDFSSYNGIARKNIAQLNSDGSLDVSFNPASGLTSIIFAMVVQADGKILTSGYDTSYHGYISRLNSDGSSDASFSAGVANDFIENIIVQSDGKILAGGSFVSYNGTTIGGIVRLQTNGALDSAFNIGSGANGHVEASYIQADGKIMISGDFTSINGIGRNRMARLNSNGNVDVSGTNGQVYVADIQPDNNVIIGGDFTEANGVVFNRVARLDVQGKVDATFDPGAGANKTVHTTTLQPDGKIIVGGDFTNFDGAAINRIVRLNDNGSRDINFNAGTGADNIIYSIAMQADGKILIGGAFTDYNGVSVNRVARLNSDGSIDANFNMLGSGANGDVRAVVLQQDGRIIIGGYFTSYNGITHNHVVRLNSDGTPDNGFDLGSGPDGAVLDIVLQNDGLIVLGGDFSSVNSIAKKFIARTLVDGSLDSSFDTSIGPDAGVETISVQADGKIVIGGRFSKIGASNRNKLARLNSNGSLDVGFVTGSGVDNVVSTTAVQTNGKIIIGGAFYSYNGIGKNNVARVLADYGDVDGDGIADNIDNCPSVSNASQTNADGDTQGDACDADDDNDGVLDINDAFPLNASESIDTDNDGTGNNADTDDDNDGVLDANDKFPLDATKSKFVRHDNNADGDSDVLVRSTSTGAWTSYAVQNGVITANAALNIPTNSDTQYVAQLDANGDGDADILTRSASTGAWTIHQIQNGAVIASAPIYIYANLVWHFVGVGDFNGDGTDDVLLRSNTTGYYNVFLINNYAVTTVNTFNAWSSPLSVDQGIGDFDGDGTDDLLIRRTTENAWFVFRSVNGLVQNYYCACNLWYNPDWTFQFAGDTNNDGTDDITVRGTGATGDGFWWTFRMSHFMSTQVTNLNLFKNKTAVTLGAVGDYNGDGTIDVLTRVNNATTYVSPIVNGLVPANNWLQNFTTDQVIGK